MSKELPQVYQFKITLKGPKPIIWRRVKVPEYYFFKDMHFCIQQAMGWDDCHLHRFEVKNHETGEVDCIGAPDQADFIDVLDEDEEKIAQYFQNPKDKGTYIYDFSDDWIHEIVLEKILPWDDDDTYPQCVAGRMACPPEDCGGVIGYERLKKIIANPFHEKYKEQMEWLTNLKGDNWQPEEFDPKSVEFIMMGNGCSVM